MTFIVNNVLHEGCPGIIPKAAFDKVLGREASDHIIVALDSRQLEIVANHGNFHSVDFGGYDEVGQIVPVADEGNNPVPAPTQRDFSGVNHIGDQMPLMLARVTGGSLEKSVVRIGQGQEHGSLLGFHDFQRLSLARV